MKLRHVIILALLLLLSTWAAYFWGRHSGETNISNIANNEIFIKEIAELAALEVQGNAHIKQTNHSEPVAWYQKIKKAFLEETIELNIPYIAKYGVVTDSSDIQIKQIGDKKLQINFPSATLLSLEFVLDRSDARTELGWLQSESNEQLLRAQKLLYQNTRINLSQSQKNKKAAEEKIKKILQHYYQETGYEVLVQFGKESPSLLIMNPK